MPIKSIKELPIKGKKVFIRVDFNVPLTDDGKVADTTRIDRALPTIKYAMEQGSKIILASHLGRPKGKVVSKYSMEPVGLVLAEKLNKEIIFSNSVVGDAPLKLSQELQDGNILLLENLRFDPGETSNDENFAKQLAELADVYINDAFGTAHRAHASTVGMVQFFNLKGMGLLLQKETEFFNKLLKDPKKPFVAVLGGAKVSDKVGVINNLLPKVDKILIGGAMANTFLAAQGKDVGQSKVEKDKFSLCLELLNKANLRKVDFLLPYDFMVASSLDTISAEELTLGESFPKEMMALDIGPKTISLFIDALKDAKTVFWNGPMGVFENPVLAEGTMSIAKAVAETDSISVIGGGDSVAAVNKSGVQENISHISTGGGASLALVEGKSLPALEVLTN